MFIMLTASVLVPLFAQHKHLLGGFGCPLLDCSNLILATRNTGKPSIDLVLLGSLQGSMWRQLSTRTSASQSGMWEVRTRYLHC